MTTDNYDKIMTTDDQIKDEKLQYGINREAAKYQPYHQVKSISINILQVKKYCLLIKRIYLLSFGKAFEKETKKN